MVATEPVAKMRTLRDGVEAGDVDILWRKAGRVQRTVTWKSRVTQGGEVGIPRGGITAGTCR